MEVFLAQLKNIKDSYRTFIRENFEFKAKDCGVCETKGACCQDAHFVNVHVTRLEAEAIAGALNTKEKLADVIERNRQAIAQYSLTEEGDTYRQTYACPLFEKETGCLVHEEGKPAPCIGHACYESKEDLPPQFLQDRVEQKITALNDEVYGETRWLPLPLWLERIEKTCSFPPIS
jgi:hypothetical protein